MFGRNDNYDLKSSHFFPALINKIHHAKLRKIFFVTIWGNGKSMRELLYVDDFADAMVARTGSATVRYPSKDWMNALQKKINSLPDLEQIKWQLIANAVRHEMTNKIAEIVGSVSNGLGEINEGSVDTLVSAINAKRPLTTAEDQYLRSIIKRASAKITFKGPADLSQFAFSIYLVFESRNITFFSIDSVFCIFT